MLFLGLAVASIAYGLSPVDTFYPNISLDYITNEDLGTYGGIYEAPANGASDPSPYGVYDYCTMPHPRQAEYKLPAAVENGSVTADLVFVEYLQRHQRRTPYNILPGGENQEYHCDNILPHLYAAPASFLAQTPMHVYAKTYTDPSNPFVEDYVQGSCQYPQLTIGGLLDGFRHGRDLWSVYGDKLHLLPQNPEDTKVWFRSSTSALTQGSAGGVLRGIWPHYAGAVPLYQQASAVDTVDAGFACSARGKVLAAIQASGEWNAHLDATTELRRDLADMFDADVGAWMSTFDHFADNFQGRLCNGYELPCSREDPTQCATREQAETVFRAGDWMWNYWWRANKNATQYIQLVEGLFIGEILERLDAVAEGKSSLVYSHNFVHDGDMGPVLGALGITQLRWPGMGSNVAIEVWKTDEDLYARVLYSGHPIRTVHGTLDWIPVDDLRKILEPFVAEDIVALCNS